MSVCAGSTPTRVPSCHNRTSEVPEASGISRLRRLILKLSMEAVNLNLAAITDCSSPTIRATGEKASGWPPTPGVRLGVGVGLGDTAADGGGVAGREESGTWEPDVNLEPCGYQRTSLVLI